VKVFGPKAFRKQAEGAIPIYKLETEGKGSSASLLPGNRRIAGSSDAVFLRSRPKRVRL
jgi:hypothetical protein